MLIPSITKPAIKINATITSGNLGKSFTMKRRCGWNATNSTQKIAKYIIYGVNIDRSIAIAKMNEYIGLGRFSPWILEPSHRSKVGQNTIIINGVPFPAKNKKGVDKTIKHDARSETLLLNQRFKSKTSKKPRAVAIRMLGSLMANVVKPKIRIESF